MGINIAASASPADHSSNWATIFTEIVIIIIAAVFATSVYANFDGTLRLGGVEAEYLTRTAYPLPSLLRETGRIPLWDPYMEMGDPMLTNPVSFYFNPILMAPSLLLGPYNGIKVSLMLTAVVAGLGGWAMGRVLGLGPLARLLLGLLLIGKGNMHSFLSQGHFAFFASQAYFPWIFAGVLGILRGYRRWPVVMVALAFALVFFCGSPWYPPALGLTVGILTLCGVVTLRRAPLARFWRAVHVDYGKLFAVSVALVLTICLSAVTFITLWNTRQDIGGTMIFTDFRADLGVILSQYVSGYKELVNPTYYPEGNSFAFYSYVLPLWFGLLVALLFALVVAARRKLPPMPWRVVSAGLIIFVFCSLWGAGANPVIEWFYQIIPLSNQFRHVERVLALSSPWLAVLVAIVVDALWLNVVRRPLWNALRQARRGQVLRRLVALTFVVVAGLASVDVLSKWHVDWGNAFVRHEDNWENYCISWLRAQHPNEPLTTWTLSYRNVYTNYRNQVRHGFVGSDFYHAQPLPSTLFAGSLLPRDGGPVNLMPEYALSQPHFDEAWMELSGYTPVPESANPYNENNASCLYRREDVFSYAYTITRERLSEYRDELPVAATTPVGSFVRDYDRVGIIAQARPDESQVVVAQELAFPGWKVQVDGKPAQIESVGGLIGVILPLDSRVHTVLFQYLPDDFYLGSAVTLITAAGMILFLLRADRIIPRDLHRRFAAGIADAWDLRGGDGA